MRPRIPLIRVIDLVAFGCQALPHVALPVDKRHRDHRYEEIGARTDDIPGEHPKATAICRNIALKTDLHGEIRYLFPLKKLIPAEFA